MWGTIYRAIYDDFTTVQQKIGSYDQETTWEKETIHAHLK